MHITLTDMERAELEAAQRQHPNVRHWRRYQAMLLRAAGTPVTVIARALGCCEDSVTNWTNAWHRDRLAGVHEGTHAGAARRLDAAGEQRLAELLTSDPQAAGYAATGWTVPLLRTELTRAGWAASERTIRRTLHRLGWSWKRPQFVLGRPDPAYAEKKAVVEQAAAMVAAGGEVWFGDETTLREFPPLRAAWARRGEPAVVLISGRNARRVLHGALNAATGEFIHMVRERSRQDDCAAFVAALGQVRPTVPKLLIWDNAPPHHPKRVSAVAEAAHITIAWLPFRAPELMPCEDVWRLMKAVVAANRAYATVVELAERAVAWLAALQPAERLRLSALLSPKFQWLST